MFVKIWFRASIVPNQYLNFIKYVFNYYDIDISNVILKKFNGYLWNLVEEVLGFAFFDNNILI